MQITTAGIDLAKDVFQIHGVDAARVGARVKITCFNPESYQDVLAARYIAG